VPATLEAPTSQANIVQGEALVAHEQEWGRKFRARLMEPGIMSYEDLKAGRALVRKETMDKYVQTFVGRPLVIKHDALSHETGEVVGTPTPQNLKEVAVGYISDVKLDDDGWYYAEGVCHDDQAKELIKKGWRVSCAYSATRGPGGVKNGIPYTHEWTSFNGEHLALVQKPRYEDATIVLHSKPNSMIKFKWFKKLAAAVESVTAPAAPAVVAATVPAVVVEHSAEEIEGDTLVEIGDRKVPLSEVIAGYSASLVEHAEMDAEDEIEIENGKKVKMHSLKGCWVAHGAAYEQALLGKTNEKTGDLEKIQADGGQSGIKEGAMHAKGPRVVKLKPFEQIRHAQEIAAEKHKRSLSIHSNSPEECHARAAERFKGVPSYRSAGKN